MKRKNRGKAIIITAILMSALAVGVWFVLRKPKTDDKDYIKKDTRILTESFPTKMLVFGDRFPVLPKGVEVEYVDHLSLELTEIAGTKYMYVMLVINDISGNVKLVDEDFEIIRQILDQKHVFFTYLGESNLAKFARFHQYPCPIDEDGNCSFTSFCGDELMELYCLDDDHVRGEGLSDGSLFEGIESAMVYMLEIHAQEVGGGIR